MDTAAVLITHTTTFRDTELVESITSSSVGGKFRARIENMDVLKQLLDISWMKNKKILNKQLQMEHNTTPRQFYSTEQSTHC
jgi:hypothetical protein